VSYQYLVPPLARPAWPPSGETYAVTYAFHTELWTSRSGKERRRARRLVPRRSLRYQVLAHGERWRQLKDLLWHWQHRNFHLAEMTRRSTLTSTASAGTTTLQVAPMPWWLRAGCALFLVHGEAHEWVAVDTEIPPVGGTVRLVEGTTLAWPVGTQVYLALEGNLNVELEAPRLTNTVARVGLAFDVAPLSEPLPWPSAALRTFGTTEVFLRRPNWAEQVGITQGHEVDVLDYGIGPWHRFSPVEFGYQTYTAVYLGRDTGEVEELVQLFYRHRGRHGEFFMPTWEPDFVLRGTAAEGESTLRVQGRHVADAHIDSQTHFALYVQLTDATLLFRHVTGVALVSDETGTDTVLSVDEPWPFALGVHNVVQMGWLLLQRFASDELTVEWLTDRVANVQLNLHTQDKPATVEEYTSVHFQLDDSGSMAFDGGVRMETLKTAMHATLDVIEDAVAEGWRLHMGMSGFNREQVERLNVTVEDVSAFRDLIDALVASGGTDFDGAIQPAVDWFMAQACDPSVTRRVNIFVTDGEPVPVSSAYAAVKTAEPLLSGTLPTSMHGINIVLEETQYTELLDNTPQDGVPVVVEDDVEGLIDIFLGIID